MIVDKLEWQKVAVQYNALYICKLKKHAKDISDNTVIHVKKEQPIALSVYRPFTFWSWWGYTQQQGPWSENDQ